MDMEYYHKIINEIDECEKFITSIDLCAGNNMAATAINFSESFFGHEVKLKIPEWLQYKVIENIYLLLKDEKEFRIDLIKEVQRKMEEPIMEAYTYLKARDLFKKMEDCDIFIKHSEEYSGDISLKICSPFMPSREIQLKNKPELMEIILRYFKEELSSLEKEFENL